MKYAPIIFGGCLLTVAGNAAEVSQHRETASGASGWRLLDDAIKIELNPLYRDQVRAFYLGRGFSEAVAEWISRQCVFQTVIENVTTPAEPVPVAVDLADWRIGDRHLVTKQERLQALEEAGASQAARLAFKWATFPEQQDFKLSGDYGWGMILFGEQPEEGFDLHAVWRVNGEAREYTISNLSCLGDAPDNE